MAESKAVCPTLASAPSYPITMAIPKKPTITMVKAMGTRRKQRVNKATKPIKAIVTTVSFLF